MAETKASTTWSLSARHRTGVRVSMSITSGTTKSRHWALHYCLVRSNYTRETGEKLGCPPLPSSLSAAGSGDKQ